VGRIGSGVRVSISFQQKYPPGSVLRCPMAVENGGYDQGGCVREVELLSGDNVEPITNTSSLSCANNGRRTPRWVLDACRRPSRLCFSHFATRTVDNTVDLYAAKPDIRLESRFLPTPPAFDPPLEGSRPNIAMPCIEKLEWCGYPMVKKFRKYLFVLAQFTNVTDGQTDTA